MQRFSSVGRVCNLGLRALVCIAAATVASAAYEPPALEITRISIAESQILIEFNRAVVPLGCMERRAEELPIRIEPQVNCHWRWISTQALACNLDQKDYLKPAHEYVVIVAPGIQAIDGATTSETLVRKRETERPDVYRAWIEGWEHPGVPVFRVRFNQPVTRESVAASLYFRSYSLADPVAVTAEPDPYDRNPPLYAMPEAPGAGEGSVFAPAQGATSEGRTVEKHEGGDARAGKEGILPSEGGTPSPQGREARSLWIVKPVAELPLGRRSSLNARTGLESALGPLRGRGRDNLSRVVTFGQFRFMGVTCRNNRGEQIRFLPDGSAVRVYPNRQSGRVSGESAQRQVAIPADLALCNPLSRVALTFNAPVLASQIAREVGFDPGLAGKREDYDPWSQVRDYSRLGWADGSDLFHVNLPERLQAFEEYRVSSRTAKHGDASVRTDIRDEFGRLLKSAIDLSFETDHRSPDYLLLHEDAVLESGIESEYPLYVTNLNEVRLNYRTLKRDGANDERSKVILVPPAKDISFAIPLGLRDMTAWSSGAVLGRIQTDPLVHDGYQHGKPFFAQVTPYQVHVKLGHYNTLVWITSLKTGKPVSRAEVKVVRGTFPGLFRESGVPPITLDSTRTDRRGVAMLRGTETLDPDLDTFSWGSQDRNEYVRLFVLVSGREGMALLPLEFPFLARSSNASQWQVWNRQRQRYGHFRAWGTTAQGVYRAGDTIQYKFYVRDQDTRTLVSPKSALYKLRIEDPSGKMVHEVKDIRLNDFGAAHGEYSVPETALMGWYRFVLSADFSNSEWQPMRVLVTDFTPAPFRVGNELNGDVFGPGDTVTVDTSASLHSGGAYTQSEARVVIDLRKRPFRSSHPKASTFAFDTSTRPSRLPVHQEMGDLDDAGNYSASVELAESLIIYGRLRAESSVRDDRGKYVSATSYADYAGVDRLVGLRKDQWVFKQNEAGEVRYIVVDERGQPVDDTGVALRIERQERKVAQVKGAGNAYLPRFTEEWIDAGECSGKPPGEPLSCAFTPVKAGTHRISAVVEDTQGRSHQTVMRVWVVGEGRVVWWERPGYGIELISEATEYEVGDTARYLVKNPFPGATALVSVERYGVIDQWQLKLQGSTPVVEFPIKPDYVPGAYLSVVIVSPRVESPPPESHQGLDYVDLGKPAFRMGYARVPVVDPYKQLEVRVDTDRTVYKPREKVSVKLRAKPRHGPRKPVEYAVAVLDEAVFDLIGQGKDYFDPYKGFYWLDSPDVANYSLLLRLVGRQKFEKKGANAGGDGGGGPDMRTLFKYVAHWEPSLPANRRGEAEFEFELPENLTGWRVLAMAVTPTDRLGLGEASFKTNLPTEIRPVMPNQVTEGDAFAAGFSVMNRTGEARLVDVVIEAEGDVDAKVPDRVESKLSLGPYRRETVYLPLRAARIKAGRDRPAGEVRFRVQAGDASDGDALAHELPVLKNRNFEVAAEYGSVIDEPATEEVLFPREIYTDTGDVSVVLSPTVIGNLEGAFRYMRDYPYACWEQKLSKALLASQFNLLKARMEDSMDWDASVGLPAQTLKQAANHQAPNGGMTYWIASDLYASPYLSAYTALGFAWLRDAGYEIPEAVEDKLLAYLQRLLRRDVMPEYFSRGMASSVRAVVLAALARRGLLSPDELMRYADHAQYMSLFGKAHFMDAALHVSGATSAVTPILTDVMDRSVASAGKVLFNEQLDRGYSRILASPLRANCALLSAFSRIDDAARLGLNEKMAMRMVRALTQTRGARTHWESTQENVFCMNALVDYARRWEAVEPAMRATATLDGKPIGETRFNDFRDTAVTLSLPILPEHPGKSAQIQVRREGEGRLYYTARLMYSPLETSAERVNAGIDVRREYSVKRDGEWTLLESGDAIRRGDLVRVDLFVNLPAARNFVVVDDPVPGGLEPVNRDLATASGVDAEQGDYKAAGGSWWYDFDDWIYFRAQRWSFYHRELRHDSVRFYSDYLPPGRYHLAYTAQAIATGDYQVRPTHAGEMYDLDIYGKAAPRRLEVRD